MPIGKSIKVTFALAIVKSNVVSDRAECSKIEAALQVMFPGVSVILVAEDCKDGLASHQRRQAISDFTDRALCRVLSSSHITAN